jgi:membrane protein DedA with SNARE-associated domain
MGPAAYNHKLVRRHLSLEREERLLRHFEKHGFWTVVVGRHTPMLRAPIFFLAGASKVPLWKFVLADALSAAVTVPIVVTLGYEFAEHLPEIRAKIHHVQWVIAAAVALALAAFWFWRKRRRVRASREQNPTTP